MEVSSYTLPLFPLQFVMLPGSVVPIHVFEDRYKTLMRDCVEGGTSFGVNLVLGGRVHRVGCTAAIEEIVRRYDDGRLDVRVRGGRKYRMTEEYSADETPYFVARVLPLEDEPDDVGPQTRTRARALLNEVLTRVYKEREKPIFIFHEERELSYQMAEFSGLDFTQRQQLLECHSERLRLEKLIGHYQTILEKLSGNAFFPPITDVDGIRLN